MIGYKLRKSARKKNNSFGIPYNEAIKLKDSHVVKYIDSYLIKNNQHFLPKIEKKLKQSFPYKNTQPVHILYAPFQPSRECEGILQKILIKNKRKTPAFSDMKKNIHKNNKTIIDTTKSQDERILMYIQEVSDSRPKSVILQSKANFIMQTDDNLM